MITREELKNGILNYADNEVLTSLPTAGKWGIGTLLIIFSSKFDNVFNEAWSNPIIKAMGIFDDNGNIDEVILLNALEESAKKYGNLSIAIPVVGVLTFSSNDVIKLRSYINGGISNERGY